ncbi:MULTISPECIES: hypothetical protein [Streptomyces]|uniref:Deoxyxylulose-5-phosphate synthase n=1 Tax=Streptomyces yunnanensis TaxID=156453 RepID=A0ABY8ABZ7_9ACTN|nr:MULTISPECIES: hypothetical protein [Streptomyces]WEB41037.1 deoxyxylulose-5-phosphate synthase [Streptomyces yunnanensis]
MPPRKSSFVCLPCRASYKQPPPEARAAGRPRHCPRCARQLIHVGSAFAAPPRRDAEGWRVLDVLLTAGVRFHTTGCCGEGPGYRPRTLREVRERRAYADATGEPPARALVRRELPEAAGAARGTRGRR